MKVRMADLYGKTKPLSIQQEELGAEFELDGRLFRYVKYNDGDANIPGLRGTMSYKVGANAANVGTRNERTCDLGSTTVVSTDQFGGIIIPDVVLHSEYYWEQFRGTGLVNMWNAAAITRTTNALTERLRPGTTDGISIVLADGATGEPQEWFALLLANVDGTPTASTDRFLATIPEHQTTPAQFAVGETVTANAKTGVVVEVLRRGVYDYGIIASTLSAAWAGAETAVGGTSVASGVIGAIGYAVFAGNYELNGF